MRDDDRGSRRFFRTRLCLYIEFFRQESVGRSVFFDVCGSDLARESCIKGCNLHERRRVKNPHLLSTMTDSARCTYEHSRCQSLSPGQVQYLSLSSDTDAHSVNGSRKRFTADDTQTDCFIKKERVKA